MKSVLESTRRMPVENWQELNEFARKMSPPGITRPPPLSGPYPTIIPCSLVHPQALTCFDEQIYSMKRAIRRTFPLYLTINFVPLLVTRFWSLVNNPFGMIYKTLFSSGRSTLFMTLITMATIGCSCLIRKFFERDSRFKFWVNCFIAPWPIVLESKSKRSEFALYVFPRAVESFYERMRQKKYIPDFPSGSILLFCVTISSLMYFREYEPSTLSNLLKKTFDLFLPKLKSQEENNDK